MEKKKEYLIIGIIVSLVLAIGGITYAYWLSGVQGEGANMNVTLDLAGASVIFTDETEIAETGVKPGWETSKTFTIENTNVVPFTYDIYIKDLINPLVEGGLQYKITSTNGYNMDDYANVDVSATAIDFDLATRVTIPANTTQEYTISIRYFNSPDVDQSEDKGKSFSGRLMIRENTGPDPNSLYAKLTNGTNYPDVKTRTDFSTPLGGVTRDASLDTTGVIYKESTYKEDGLDVYYFAGNPLDNWVKFAGFYWRIIRTNENGSVRLLYAGTRPDTIEGYISKSPYNSTYNNTMYVGWTYGTTGSLANNRNGNNEVTAKAALDTWYQNNLKTEYGKYIEDNAIYCNDRSGDGYQPSSAMYYAAYNRLVDNKRPTYRCGGKPTTDNKNVTYNDVSDEDKFTVSNATMGNKRLKNPVGLMTADEVAFAGGLHNTDTPNTYYYLNSIGSSVTDIISWWTMSPYVFGSNNSTYMFNVIYSGRLSEDDLYDIYGVRPVLSLKSDVLVSSGDGTAESPYEVTLP